MIEVSYSEARARLAELLDRVTEDREVVHVRRQGNKPGAVIIDADDYASLEETAYLLSSPANARHILRGLVELEAGQGRAYQSVDDFWRELDEQPAVAEGAVPATVELMAALRTSIETARQHKTPPGASAETPSQEPVESATVSDSAPAQRRRGSRQARKA
jgi:antitoxin YefM